MPQSYQWRWSSCSSPFRRLLPSACWLGAPVRTRWGPRDIGHRLCVFAVQSMLSMIPIFAISVQAPNDAALWITAAFLDLMGAVWFAFEHGRFKGPPIGAEIDWRQQDIR